MNLKHMQSFVVLAEELHFGRAAARLHIVQPALTQHIHHLEDELGLQLLIRSSRKVSLTPAGLIFFGESRRAIQQIDYAQQSARDAAEGLAGRLKVGFVDNTVWSVFPGIIRAFRQNYPRVELDLLQLARTPQISALEKGELDVAILPGPIQRPDLDVIKLIDAPVDVVLPSGHKLCAMKNVPIKALSGEPFISFSSAADTHTIAEIVQNMFSAAGFVPILGQAVHQMHTALALVSAGCGITTVPRWMRHAWTHNVEFRPLTPTCIYELVMATSAGHKRPATVLFRRAAELFLRTVPRDVS